MFRAFVEGQTISDGRKIEAGWIDEIAASFNAENYAPRVNVEHISGYSPEPPFNGYGTVVAVEAKTDAFTIDGKAENRRCLYVQVDGNDQLVQLAARDQKPYPSVELTDSYAGTGKVGLIGLAFTDTPASIGTQRLQFSRSAPGTHFSVAPDAVAIEFEAKQPDSSAGAFSAMKAFFDRLTSGSAATPPAQTATPTPPTPPAPANDNFAQIREGLGLISASLTALDAKVTADVGALRGEYATLKTKVETTAAPNGFSRPPATGGTGGQLTDC
ncbi:GPO family capsid scaffolding protein [Sphingomonas sp. GC_Shp_6]|nr:GPO family capsid scaffolding protein [Sphingomonas sp. GC_Shp_6]